MISEKSDWGLFPVGIYMDKESGLLAKSFTCLKRYIFSHYAVLKISNAKCNSISFCTLNPS